MSAFPKPDASKKPAPRLESGDRLTRAEFRRRYEAMPESTRAQLIEGVVYRASPVRATQHAKPHVILTTWLGTYLLATPGLEQYGDNATVRLDEENEPQPDLVLLLPARLGGAAQVDAEGYISGPPAWVAEIAASSVSIDLHMKLNAYRRNGVREYLVWRTEEAEVDWFTLRDGQYVPLGRDEQGWIRSEVFPGLWLDAGALVSLDLRRLLGTLALGTQSAEHADFVRRLGGG